MVPVIDRRAAIEHARELYTYVGGIDNRIWNAITPGECNGDCDADCA